MKKIIAAIVILTMILLIVTKSLYVEWTELFMIIGSLSVISILFNKRQSKFGAVLGSSAVIGFLFSLVFGLIDLIADHFMYFLPDGNEDGLPLSLGFKVQEFSDDLFVASFISMVSVLIVSFLTSLTLKLFAKNQKIDI